MANTKSAEKRIRQGARRNANNKGYRSRMRNAITSLRADAAAGNLDAARSALPATLSIIDKTATKGVIHANTAARYKSRLTKLVADKGSDSPADTPPADPAA